MNLLIVRVSAAYVFLSAPFQASLFPVSHQHKTAGKTSVLCRHSNAGFSEWETRGLCALSCNVVIWFTNRFNVKKLYILPTPYICFVFLSERAATSVLYVVGSRSFRPDQLFKVTNKTALLFFNIVSLYLNTLFNWYINLTIDDTIYPSQHFPFGAALVCQAGNFWTLLRIS